MEIVERAEYFRQEDTESRETLAVTKEDLRRAIYAGLPKVTGVNPYNEWLTGEVWEDLQNGVRKEN